MKRRICLMAMVLILSAAGSLADETRLEPKWPVPDYVTWILDVASGEVGYREGEHGWTKYGEWSGDPYAQWCAEFLCWCVDQVDQQHGTQLLGSVYPRYSGQNTGRSWYIREGRYIVRWGNLDGWGYQWLKGSDHFLTTGDYIPEPGDWIFFTWTDNEDTDHVAMVEFCTMDENGNVTVHCIEGNTPVAVKRAEYPLTYTRILGFGTVHDAADWTIRSGNSGEKVRQLQGKLVALGYLQEDQIDGVYGNATAEAIRAFQTEAGIRVNSVANLVTQQAMDSALRQSQLRNPDTWQVEDDDDFSGLGDWDAIDQLLMPTASPVPEDDLSLDD